LEALLDMEGLVSKKKYCMVSICFITPLFCKALILCWPNMNLFINILLGLINFNMLFQPGFKPGAKPSQAQIGQAKPGQQQWLNNGFNLAWIG
jgi:hypothetical protein